MTGKPIKPNPELVLNSLRPLWRGSEHALANVFAFCLREMLVLYYPPFRATDDVELTDLTVTGIKAYAEDLAEFDVQVLEDGWRQARRAHKVERWPTIQDIRDACLAQVDRRGGSRREAQPAAERFDGPERKPIEKFPHRSMADQWLSSEQGQWALRHNCGSDCWDAIAEHGQPLTRDGIAKIERDANARFARLEDLIENGNLAPPALSFAKRPAQREAEMRRKYLKQERAA